MDSIDIMAKAWLYDNIIPSLFLSIDEQPPDKGVIPFEPSMDPFIEKASLYAQAEYIKRRMKRGNMKDVFKRISELWLDLVLLYHGDTAEEIENNVFT